MGDKPYTNRRKRQEWRVIETQVKENAGVEVSMLPLPVPRFSFRVGTAHYPQEEGGEIKVSSRLTNFNVQDAIDLLEEVSAKYIQIREDAIDEIEERKRVARQNAQREAPEVIVRRSQSDD